MTYKPRLLRETAEIAFTEIKRFIEPRLREDFSLRRVSAPLYLPVGSPLLPPWAPGARVRLEAAKHDVEIVGALDLWLRDQLTRNDIAPGFGVFTIMNALRPDLPENLTSSPYVAAWAWQQATDRADARPAGMIAMARKVHSLLIETDSMILSLFPHLQSTLSTHLEEVDENDLASLYPAYDHDRRIYERMRPDAKADDRPRSLLFVWRRFEGCIAFGELWAWNRIISHPVMLADFAARDADAIAGPSLGGNIYRQTLALQLLHLDRFLL